jgi:hypothetical protein
MNDLIECWNCKHDVHRQHLSECDGFCPFCDCEIDLDEEPYKKDTQE